MADAPLDASLEEQLAAARAALERGDYGRVVRLLEPLTREHPSTTQAGAEIQLLLATAWMGQGDNTRAMVCCRLIKRCRDATLRAQAQDLLTVLEAPALERPRDWSITLPDLGSAQAMGSQMQQLARSRRANKPPPPPPPPVGPTRAPVGFALLAVVLLLLTVLLGGCMEVRTELNFKGPGRLQITHALISNGAQPPPWGRQFSQLLQSQGFRPAPTGAASPGPGDWQQRLQSQVLAAPRALELLARNLSDAAQLAGVTLPAPELALQERNWLVGVHQTLELAVDLREVQPLPGFSAAVELSPAGSRAVQRAGPEPAQALPGRQTLRWPLRFGARNTLQLTCWRWSGLGLGGLLIAAGLALVLALERLRRLLGFGLPELPA
ncbi:DUF3153 domain-containing protein [Cyanobium sp. Alchichica 3B3-8F6]|uniref:DUF3153 domain-containing protein n=1 Tax=Cyanobium sp. Alchichica 3B3-8F6 TaxID=2823696 RepID=UPI0020CEED50|nr:DUF3153 domain-containing protein [Cyanobium sp. Alchichica 3B3-8F6]MCP9881907.1 DUF3153 domain-containing protein [Cyanobium sp. Alchichica 3B3-8F6]